MVKRGLMDQAVGADWTPATGDVKISKDGGATANITTLPVAIAMGNGAIWDFAISATEMSAAKIAIIVADTATKAVEDQMFAIITYGNASAEFPGIDFASTTNLASVTTAALSANVITATAINADAITAAKVADGTIDAATFAAGAINAAAIANAAIDEATFAADTAKYQAKIGWIDDNANTTDRYLVIYFKNGEPVVSGITNPDIWVYNNAGTDIIGTSASPITLTQIGSSGTYTRNEGTNRLVNGAAYIARVRATIDSATRTWYQFLGTAG